MVKHSWKVYNRQSREADKTSDVSKVVQNCAKRFECITILAGYRLSGPTRRALRYNYIKPSILAPTQPNHRRGAQTSSNCSIVHVVDCGCKRSGVHYIIINGKLASFFISTVGLYPALAWLLAANLASLVRCRNSLPEILPFLRPSRWR